MTMQGKDMKAIRQDIGLSQAQFADELGMTSTFVGLMERGERPIEKRTALAVWQLANQQARLRGNHDVIELPEDVPIAKAQIMWDRYDEADPPVKVIGIPGQDDDRYSSHGGACMSDWEHSDDVGRLLRLFTLFVELTVDEKIPAAKVHEAFSVIPEYRRAMHVTQFKEGVAA